MLHHLCLTIHSAASSTPASGACKGSSVLLSYSRATTLCNLYLSIARIFNSSIVEKRRGCSWLRPVEKKKWTKLPNTVIRLLTFSTPNTTLLRKSYLHLSILFHKPSSLPHLRFCCYPGHSLPSTPFNTLQHLHSPSSTPNMVYSLTYRRPPHVDSARASVLGDEKTQSIGEASIDSQGTGMSFGIPDALSFDRIMAGGTCPVSTFTSHPRCFHELQHCFWHGPIHGNGLRLSIITVPTELS